MKIGVVCESDERFRFFRKLVGGHRLFHIYPDDSARDDRLTKADGVLIDGPLMSLPLHERLRAIGFVFGNREDDCPCVVRHDDAGNVEVQCGRQASTRMRAADGRARVTHTLVFQHQDVDIISD